mmetsp:Transcript_129851/g.375936  ORF Transcript_129851/g.375936 Transcript_129851/m.375936 type:complete len:285 (-) Transcript_129851:168-1022(-)
MALNFEVSPEGLPDGEVLVVGADEALGAWDVARAVRLTCQGAAVAWTGSVALPSPESEFKLVVRRPDGAVEWEPLSNNGNRRFPARGVHNGCTLRMQFGSSRIAIQASPEEIEANARAVRRMEDRQGSALQENVNTKGANAYYFAHTRTFEVPPDAKIISGPGLITGGAPVLLEAGHALDLPEQIWLKEYSWSDSKDKVKVYVPLPEGLLPPDGADSLVEFEYDASRVALTINTRPKRKLQIDKLNEEINVEKCTGRVEAHKSRIVLQLAKAKSREWHKLTKTK